MFHESNLCLSALGVVKEMLKCEIDNILFQETVNQAIETAKYLRTRSEYAAETDEFLNSLERK